MEKNLTEKSSSFAKRDDHNQNDGGDSKDQTPRALESSLPEDQKDVIIADSDDPKTNGNDDDDNAATTTEAKGDEEEKANEENKDEVVAAPIEEVIESPSRSLEKASEDVDQYLEGGSVSENIPDFVDKFLELVEEKIATYDSGDVKGKWGKNAEEDSSLLNFMDRISKLMKLLMTPSSTAATESSESSSSEEELINKRRESLVNQMGILEHRVMSYFEEEFRFSLMEESPKPGESEANNNNESKGKQQEQTEQDQNPQQTDQESTETEAVNFPGYPEETITKLKQLAKEMKSTGYEHECWQVYTMCRRFAFEENLIKIGFEKISMDDILKMQWKTLENHIPTWIKTFKDCITIYLPREKKLAESVFEFRDNPNICLTQGLVTNLINFAEGVAMTKRAPEKLFKILDMFEALRDVMPKFDELYPSESANDLKTDTSLAKSRLGEAMIHIFGDLENAIKTEAGKSVVPGGAVHPLTRYLMNYLPYACEYKETLEQVFKELSKIERADSTSRPHYEGSSNTNTNTNNSNTHHNHNNKNEEEQSPFQAQLVRLMSLLDFNLEAKAKQYRDLPLSSIFMMNNGRYILQKIKGSPEIYTVMGETWCRKRSSDLRSYHKNYQRETWTKILTCLSPEGLTVNGKVQKPLLKERFKSFNATFDEIHKTQSTWIVSDEQLQSELRVSITGLVIPAYRAFLGRFSQILDPGRQTEKYIKYQAEDLEPLIDELFDGNAPSTNKRRP